MTGFNSPRVKAARDRDASQRIEKKKTNNPLIGYIESLNAKTSNEYSTREERNIKRFFKDNLTEPEELKEEPEKKEQKPNGYKRSRRLGFRSGCQVISTGDTEWRDV